MSKQSRQAIARNQKYNQLEEQPRPQSWSARMPTYAGTMMEARGGDSAGQGSIKAIQ